MDEARDVVAPLYDTLNQPAKKDVAMLAVMRGRLAALEC